MLVVSGSVLKREHSRLVFLDLVLLSLSFQNLVWQGKKSRTLDSKHPVLSIIAVFFRLRIICNKVNTSVLFQTDVLVKPCFCPCRSLGPSADQS